MWKFALLLGTLVVPSLATVISRVECVPGSDNIYQFNATLLDESATVNFGDYAGKVSILSAFLHLMDHSFIWFMTGHPTLQRRDLLRSYNQFVRPNKYTSWRLCWTRSCHSRLSMQSIRKGTLIQIDNESKKFQGFIFFQQEPGSGYDEIMNGITYVRPGGGFVPQITLFEKSEVNGDAQLPIYTWMKVKAYTHPYAKLFKMLFHLSELLFVHGYCFPW